LVKNPNMHQVFNVEHVILRFICVNFSSRRLNSKSPKAMPIYPRWIGRIMIEKTAKDGRKLQKMSARVQMWTRLENLGSVNLAGRIRRVGDSVNAQFQGAGSSTIVSGKSPWQSPQKK
jgi:hypothetical protein